MQPWMDYFAMLRTYEKKGYLDVRADKHEAYITQAALLTLAGADASQDQSWLWRVTGSTGVVRNIRSYAAWKSLSGGDYMSWNFALHVVKDDQPHDLLCTILLSHRRRWYRLWLKTEAVEVIGYTGDGKE